MANPWYKRHSNRLKAERIIFRDRFPQFVLKQAHDGQLFWQGILRTNFKTRFYLVEIYYPRNYPYHRPIFFIVKPKIKRSSPHLYANGSLCVYPDHWNHKQSTAVAGVPLVASWLANYEIWLRTGRRW